MAGDDYSESDPSREFHQLRRSIIEALAPELREAVHGRGTDPDRFREELKYQLKSRGGVTGDDEV